LFYQFAKFISLISLLVIASLGGGHASTIDVSAAKKISLGITSFSKFTTILPGDGVSLGVSVNRGGTLVATYIYENKEKEIFRKRVVLGEEIFLPASDKFIVLTNTGAHEFNISLSSETLTETETISVFVSAPRDKVIFDDIGKISATGREYVEGAFYNPSPDMSRQSDYGPDKLSIFSTRANASSIYKELSPSVVLVAAKGSLGTGSVVSKDGEILTNWHVVGKNEAVVVVFKPGKFANVSTAEKLVADVVKIDEEKDLALIKLRNPPNNLKPITLGDETDIEIAMDVHAIGHPKGNFWTYTKGVLSQIRPKFKWSTGQGVKHRADVIQTQTPINPGNSGGPLISDNKKIIGVNSFIDQKAQGLNFAVAITSVKEFIRSKEVHKKATQVGTSRIPVKGLRVDLDKDGRRESILFDTNQNGRVDRISKDEDGDGQIDIVFIDKDESGKPEMTIRFLTVKGQKVAVIGFDKNEDGKPEVIGYDFERDGKIDKYEKV
jgi:S1-C subfamily serine protease